MSSPQIPGTPIDHRIGADVCAGNNTRVAAAADGRVDRDGPDERRAHLLNELASWRLRREALYDLCTVRRYGALRREVLDDRCTIRNSVQESVRSSDDYNLCSNLSWAARLKVIQELCSGLIYTHKMHSIHMDFKLSNILLDDDYVPKLSDFGLSRLLCGGVKTSVPMFRAADTHNSPCNVEFTLAASAKQGIEIKIGSHVIHAPKYLSVHHPLIQMVLFAHKIFDDTFACLKTMAPKSIFDMAKRLCSSASPNVCEADWNSSRSKSESPKVRTVSEFSTGKSIGRSNELTDNESHPSDPDSGRAEHGIKEGKAKTSAAWVVSTAAPHHVTGNRDLLSGFITEHDDQFVHAVDRVPMKVLARGSVVTDAVVLPDVWFVPGLRSNLVSVNQLAVLDYSVGFGCGECCIRNAADGKIMGKAHLLEGGLYELDFLKVPLAI